MLNISLSQINCIFIGLGFINFIKLPARASFFINLASILYIIVNLCLFESFFTEAEKYFALSFLLSLCFYIIYSLHDFKEHKIKLFLGLVLSFSAINILAISNIWLIMIYLELITFSSFSIIINSPHKKSKNLGFLYLLSHIFSSLVIIFGLATSGINSVNIINFDIEQIKLLTLNSQLIIMIGFFILIGLPPFTSWLASAYSYVNTRSVILIQSYATVISLYLLAKIFHNNNYLFYISILIAIASFLLSIFETNIRKIINYSNIFNISIILILTTYSNNSNYLKFIGLYALCSLFYKVIFALLIRKISPLMEKTNLMQLGNIYLTNPKLGLLGIAASLGFIAFPGTIIYFTKTQLLFNADLTQNQDLVHFLAYLPVFFITWQYYLLFNKNDTEPKKIEFKINEIILLIIACFALFIPGIYLLVDYNMFAMLKSLISLFFLILIYCIINNLFKPNEWFAKLTPKNSLGLIKLNSKENLFFSNLLTEINNYVNKYKNLLIPYTISTNLLLCIVLLVILIIFIM